MVRRLRSLQFALFGSAAVLKLLETWRNFWLTCCILMYCWMLRLWSTKGRRWKSLRHVALGVSILHSLVSLVISSDLGYSWITFMAGCGSLCTDLMILMWFQWTSSILTCVFCVHECIVLIDHRKSHQSSWSLHCVRFCKQPAVHHDPSDTWMFF